MFKASSDAQKTALTGLSIVASLYIAKSASVHVSDSTLNVNYFELTVTATSKGLLVSLLNLNSFPLLTNSVDCEYSEKVDNAVDCRFTLTSTVSYIKRTKLNIASGIKFVGELQKVTLENSLRVALQKQIGVLNDIPKSRVIIQSLSSISGDVEFKILPDSFAPMANLLSVSETVVFILKSQTYPISISTPSAILLLNSCGFDNTNSLNLRINGLRVQFQTRSSLNVSNLNCLGAISEHLNTSKSHPTLTRTSLTNDEMYNYTINVLNGNVGRKAYTISVGCRDYFIRPDLSAFVTYVAPSDMPPSSNENYAGMTIGLAVGFVMLVAVGLAIAIVRRQQKKKSSEDAHGVRGKSFLHAHKTFDGSGLESSDTIINPIFGLPEASEDNHDDADAEEGRYYFANGNVVFNNMDSLDHMLYARRRESFAKARLTAETSSENGPSVDNMGVFQETSSDDILFRRPLYIYSDDLGLIKDSESGHHDFADLYSIDDGHAPASTYIDLDMDYVQNVQSSMEPGYLQIQEVNSPFVETDFGPGYIDLATTSIVNPLPAFHHQDVSSDHGNEFPGVSGNLDSVKVSLPIRSSDINPSYVDSVGYSLLQQEANSTFHESEFPEFDEKCLADDE